MHPGPEDEEVIGYLGGVQSQAIAIVWSAEMFSNL